MTADKPENAPTTEGNTPVGEPPTGSGLEPTSGREVGQGVEPVEPNGPTVGSTGDSTQQDRDRRKEAPAVHRQTRIGAAWVALVVGLLVLVLLLIFILQNWVKATVKFFGAEGQLPLGVLLLFAAAGGALIVVVFGAARMMQLRWLARRDRRTARKKP